MRVSHPARPSRSLLVVGAALLTATLAASLGTAPASAGDGDRAAKSPSVSAGKD
ncbi:hypothetical protein [Streptomyces agglomeratus]|uniref:hypothetical protein n=1 Tax=Streptomyces agglomeratus TaxID=285458 RepID=UPI001428D230|nr:hypothetical protein [Streptomyces agglomeratus]